MQSVVQSFVRMSFSNKLIALILFGNFVQGSEKTAGEKKYHFCI